MKTIGLVVFAITVLTGATGAAAAQGCGPAFHRDYYGRCVPNGGAAFYGPPQIGVFYSGPGYWFGGRYWGHRYGRHGGWRYR